MLFGMASNPYRAVSIWGYRVSYALTHSSEIDIIITT